MVSGSSNASKKKPFSALPAVSITFASSRTKPSCSFPLRNVDGVGLRRAISDEEVERLFGLLGDGKIDNHQNWKGRFKDNSDKMRSGSIYDVADVLKSLTFLAKSKSLSFREKRMLDRAKFLDHLRSVRGDARDGGRHRSAASMRALERCFSTKARTIARAKVVKVAPRAPPPAAAAPRARCPRVLAQVQVSKLPTSELESARCGQQP